MSDLPIEGAISEDTPIEENNLPSTELPQTPLQANTEAVQATSMKIAGEGMDPLEAWTDLTANADIPTAYAEQRHKERQNLKMDIAGAYQDELVGVDDPQTIQDTTQVTTDMVSEINSEEDTPGGKWKPYLRAISGQFGGQEDIDRESVLQELRNDLSEAAKDLSALDIGRDIAIGLIPGGILKDSYDLTKGQDEYSAKEVLQNIVTTFKNSDPAKQKELWPLYKDFLFSNLPESQAVNALSELLDPANEAETPTDFNLFWQAFDTVDVALTTTGAVVGAAKVIKQTNAIRTSRRVGNDDLASTINEIVLSDRSGQAAEVVGETRADAADNAVGMSTTPDYTSGLNLHARARIERLRQRTAQLNEDIVNKDINNPEPLLMAKAQERAQAAKAEEFNLVREEMVEQGASVTDSRMVDSNEHGVTFEFDYSYDTIDGPATGVERRTYTYGLDDVGSLEDLELGLMPGIRSPLGIYKGDVAEVAEAAIRLEDQAGAMKLDFDSLVKEALKPVTKGIGKKVGAVFGNRSTKKIEKILQSGDSQGKMFTAQELRSGVNGVKLSDKEIESYFNLRTVYDGLWWADNNAQRKALVSKGFKSTQVDGQDLFIKPLAANQARKSTSKAYDPATGQLVSLDNGVDSIYAQGRSVAKVDGQMDGVGGKYTHVIVDDVNVREVGTITKPYRTGYVPRIRENGLYYVKSSKTTSVDGVRVDAFGAGSSIKTLRSFDTKKQAEAFAAAQADSITDGSTLRVLQDRELEAEGQSLDGIGQSGLFKGSRSSEGVLHGSDGTEPVLLDPLESLSRNVAHISNKISRSEWRLARQQEWINTANKYLGSHIDNFEHPLPQTDIGKSLERLRSDIRTWGRIPDQHESDLASGLQKVFEWALDSNVPAGQSIANSARWLKQKDPIGQIKGAAFHTLLGWFNPIQLWVQAQGASVALSIAPTLAPKALMRQTALMMTEYVTSPKAIALTAKSVGMKPDDLMALKKLYDKTGLGKSIKANADIVDAVNGGTSSLRGLADKGLIFYRAGEGFTRRTSFNMALLDYVKKTPGKNLQNISDADLRKINTRANDFMLNLNKGNMASWQQGVLSIPTQFMQVTAKAWSTMAPQFAGGTARFTSKEKMKIFAGQLALYGTAGIPLSAAVSEQIAKQMGVTQENIDNLDPNMKAMLNGGIESMFFYNLFGEELVIGSRASLASGIDGIKDLLFDRRMPIYESIAGPSGTVFKRSKEVYDKFAAITLDMNNRDVTLEQAGEAFKQLGGMVSSTRNLQKAWEMHVYSWMTNSKAEFVAQGFNTAEAIASSIGFQLQREADIYSIQDLQKAKKELVKNTKTSLRAATLSFLKHGDSITPDIVDTYENIKSALVANKSFTPSDLEDLKNSHSRFLKGLLNKESKESRALKKLVKDYIDAIPEDFRAITSTGVIQINSNEQVQEQVFTNYEKTGEIE